MISLVPRISYSAICAITRTDLGYRLVRYVRYRMVLNITRTAVHEHLNFDRSRGSVLGQLYGQNPFCLFVFCIQDKCKQFLNKLMLKLMVKRSLCCDDLLGNAGNSEVLGKCRYLLLTVPSLAYCL